MNPKFHEFLAYDRIAEFRSEAGDPRPSKKATQRRWRAQLLAVVSRVRVGRLRPIRAARPRPRPLNNLIGKQG